MKRIVGSRVIHRLATVTLAFALVAGFQLAAPAPAAALSSVATITSMNYTSGRLYNAADTTVATWASGTEDYTLRITRSSVTLIPTVATGATWTCDVDGAPNDDCFATGLSVGDDAVFDIEVTAQDGVTTKDYTITAVRYATDATLTALALSQGTLTPTFDTDTTSYKLSTNATTIDFDTVTPTDLAATYKCYKGSTEDADCSNISLGLGSNALKVVVTAADGSTTKTYSITATRVADANADVIALKLNHGGLLAAGSNDTTYLNAAFSSSTLTYDLTTNGGSLTVTPILASDGAVWHCEFDGTEDGGSPFASNQSCTVTPDTTEYDLVITVDPVSGSSKVYTFHVKKFVNANTTAPDYTVAGDARAGVPLVSVTDWLVDWTAVHSASSFFRRWFSCTSDHASDNAPDSVPTDCTFTGVTTASYTPKTSDIGKYVLVAYIGHPGSVLAYGDGRYVTGAPSMKNTSNPPAPDEEFLVSTDVGDTISLVNTDDSDDFRGLTGPGDIKYTWMRCTNPASSALFGTVISIPGSCSFIKDAFGVRVTTATYAPVAADAGKYIRARVILKVTGFPEYQILTRSTNQVYGVPVPVIDTAPGAPSAPSLSVTLSSRSISAGSGSWSGFPKPPTSTASAFSYKWFYCTKSDRARDTDPATRTYNGDFYCFDTGETEKTLLVTDFYCGFYLLYGVAIDNTVRGHGGLSEYQWSPTSTGKVAGTACY